MKNKRIKACLQAFIVGALTIGLFTPVQQFAGIGEGKYPGKCAIIGNSKCSAEPSGSALKLCMGVDVETDGYEFTVPSFSTVSFVVKKIGNFPTCNYKGDTGSSSCVDATVRCEWTRDFGQCPNGYWPDDEVRTKKVETTVPSGDSYCPAYKAGGSSVDSAVYQK